METFIIARIKDRWPASPVNFAGVDIIDDEGKTRRLSEEMFGDDWRYVKQLATIELTGNNARVIEKAPSHQVGHK